MSQEYQCSPQISGVHFNGERDWQVSARLIELYEADQAARQAHNAIDWETLIPQDRARREEVLTYLQAGVIVTAEDLDRAALIFQHGDCPEHYALAADLALRAFNLGRETSGWLHAAAIDRYLQSTGQLQKYGTQYVLGMDGHFALCPVSGEISDEERAVLGLPSLVELQARAQEFDELIPVDPNPFAFLTKIPLLGKLLNAWSVLKNCIG